MKILISVLGVFFALGFGVMFAIGISAYIKGKRDNQKIEDFLKEHKIIVSNRSRFWDGHNFFYDDVNKKLWIYKPATDTYSSSRVDQLLGCEVKIDGSTEYRKLFRNVPRINFSGKKTIVEGVTGKEDENLFARKLTLIIYYDHGKGFSEIDVFTDPQGAHLNNRVFREKYDLALSWCKFIEKLCKAQ